MFLFKKDSAKQHHELALKLRDPFRSEYNLFESVNHFKRALSERPDNYRYHFDLGRTYMLTPHMAVTRGVNVHFKLEDAVTLAIEQFKEAIRLDPKFVASYLNLAHCYIIKGDQEEAVAAYTEYLKVTKQKLVRSEEQLQKSDKARKRLQKSDEVEEKVPKLDVADERLQNMEYALMKRRKKEAEPEKAEQHLQQALSYRSEGKYRRAAKELEKAYAVAPDVPWIYKRLYKLGR